MDKTKLAEILELHTKFVIGAEDGVCADLSDADLSYKDIRHTDLRRSNLSNADLQYADLSNTDLRGANMTGANLRNTNLCNADMSQAKGIESAIAYLADNFEKTERGYIAYKIFGLHRIAPGSWVIGRDSVISENVNFDRTNDCACGVNVATRKWINHNNAFSEPVWKVLIEWEWLPGVCVPYHTDGKIRCERVRLLEIMEEPNQ